MDVGNGCMISDKWIPVGVDTGLNDYDGNPIKTSDQVSLTGCSSRFAIIGRNMNDKFVLYFGSDAGSVSWGLSEKVVQRNKVRVVKSQ